MASLYEIAVEDLAATQQRALLRLHLKVAGDTHKLFAEFVNNLKAAVLAAADTETGKVDPGKVERLLAIEEELWLDTFGRWIGLFRAARRVAVWLPCGQLARLHDHYFGQFTAEERRRLEEQLQIGLSFPTLQEDGDWSPVFWKFDPVVRNVAARMQALTDGGAALKYSDGKTLSDRIWRLSGLTHGRIQSYIRTAATTGDSAWNLARQLERHVKASAACPRWTSTRLRLTKQEIASGDKRGLISGPSPCATGGVAYAALRLARNEIQIGHHMATDEIFGAMPWVQREYIRLSPDHPDIDCRCPDIASGGPWAPKWPGLYPKGQIILPLHIQCLCYKEASLMHPTRFVNRARAWMTGEKAWPAMDQYMTYLGLTDQGPIEVAAEEPEARGDAVAADPFPEDLGELRKVRDLGGSTGAELVEDAQGRQFVRKTGASPEHLVSECMADALYQEAGVNVPRFRVYEDAQGKPVKLSEYIDGAVSLGSLYGDTSEAGKARLARALEQLRKGFVVDALLGNWDVIGLDADNVLVDRDGNAWRIDNGGSLAFRAQGRPKTADQWNAYVRELWTLRDPSRNAQTVRVFGSVTFADVVDQVEALQPKAENLFARILGLGADQGLQNTLRARLDQLVDLAGTARTMNADTWKWSYIDGFARHLTEFRARGISRAMPASLRHTGVQIKDENGYEWDHLRGRDSVVKDIAAYMSEQGGDWSTVAYWMAHQGGDSWSGASQAVKWYYTDQREKDKSAYFWREGEDKAHAYYTQASTKVGEQKWEASYQVYHAFNYEMLHQIDFERNKRAEGLVELIRTESARTRARYDMTPGGFLDYPRGAVESCSIYQTVVVSGNHMTMMEVPHHRVLGSYFFERQPGVSDTPFYGDMENEFVVMLEGTEARYHGTVMRGQSTTSFWRDYYRDKKKRRQ